MAQTSDRFYHPELDVLRFCAFFMVYAWHCLPKMPTTFEHLGLPGALSVAGVYAGAYGVDLFFALSAYLITELLLREQRACGRIDVRAFYVRRVLRIWPLYLAFLLIGTVVLGLVDSAQQFGWKYYATFLLFAGNWACAVWGYPASAAGPLWSVSIEEQFYLTWPLVMRHCGKHLHRICIGLIACAIAIRYILVKTGVEHPGIWCNTLARLDPIAGGALLALVLNGRVPRLQRAVRVVMVMTAATLFVVAGTSKRFDGVPALFSYPIVAAASVLAICGVLSAGPRHQYGSLMRAGVYLGRISYGLYVFHEAAIHFTVVPSGSATRWAVNIVSSFGLTVLLAAVSFRYLESPFLRMKDRFSYIGPEPEPEALRAKACAA
jgi:peptidoglycan/LPS O-acetylase OafA/YrhL